MRTIIVTLLMVLSYCCASRVNNGNQMNFLAEDKPCGTNKSAGENITWTVKSNTLFITGSGRMNNFTQDDRSPWDNCAFTSVVIEEGISSIGDNCFADSVLDSIQIPSSVNSIGIGSFALSRLQSLSIPWGVKYINEGAFFECDVMKSITIPSTVSFIGEKAFWGCYDLQSVVFYGTNNPRSAEEVFSNQPKSLCVPISYESSFFCGCSVNYSSKYFQNLKRYQNQCYDVLICSDNESDYILDTKEAVREWERRSNGCVNYFCDNETGQNSTLLCLNDDETRWVCVNDDCVQYPELKNTWRVEVECDLLNPSELDKSFLCSFIRNKTQIEIDEVNIGYELDEQGFIKGFVVLVDDESNAQIIGTLVKDCSSSSDS